MLANTFRSDSTKLFSALALVILMLGMFNTDLENSLRYDREAIFSGEVWRLITAHLLHLTWGHLWMNLAGLLLVLVFFGNLLTFKEWSICLFIASIGTALFTLALVPSVSFYVGLSGVLHGLFIAGGIRNLFVRKKEALIFLSLITLKLLWEQYSGPLPGSEETAGGPVLVDAHLYGALSGLLAITLLGFRK